MCRWSRAIILGLRIQSVAPTHHIKCDQCISAASIAGKDSQSCLYHKYFSFLATARETLWQLYIHMNSFTSWVSLSKLLAQAANNSFLHHVLADLNKPDLFIQSRDWISMLPILPGGEPEDSGDEAGRQAVDIGLRRRPAQGPIWPAQLSFLLLLAELPPVEDLQQLHGSDPKSSVLLSIPLLSDMLKFCLLLL